MFRSILLLGIKQGINKKMIKKLTDESLLPVGSIILIIGAGGGFKQILIESGVGTAIAQMAEHNFVITNRISFHGSWFNSNCNRFSYSSINDSSRIVSPVIQHMSGVNLELLVIATVQDH